MHKSESQLVNTVIRRFGDGTKSDRVVEILSELQLREVALWHWSENERILGKARKTYQKGKFHRRWLKWTGAGKMRRTLGKSGGVKTSRLRQKDG
jgi:hypothetical protein